MALKEEIKKFPDAVGSLADGARNAAREYLSTAGSVLSGGKGAAGSVAGGVGHLGSEIAGRGVGLVNGSMRFTGAALTRFPWVTAIVATALAVGPIRNWWNKRQMRKQVNQLNEMNNVMEAQLGAVPLDDTRSRTAELARARQATSQSVGVYNPDDPNFRAAVGRPGVNVTPSV